MADGVLMRCGSSPPFPPSAPLRAGLSLGGLCISWEGGRGGRTKPPELPSIALWVRRLAGAQGWASPHPPSPPLHLTVERGAGAACSPRSSSASAGGRSEGGPPPLSAQPIHCPQRCRWLPQAVQRRRVVAPEVRGFPQARAGYRIGTRSATFDCITPCDMRVMYR